MNLEINDICKLTDDELHDQIINSDAYDQDGEASNLFRELWGRYKYVKERLVDYSEI